jgi:hypothetical protein
MPDRRATSDAAGGATITRRQGLAGLVALGGLAGLAACSTSTAPEASPANSTASAAISPTVADERSLLARYDATIAAFPALAPGLSLVRDQHAEHLRALGSPATPSGSASDPAGTAVSLPTDPTAAVGALIDAERSAMRLRVDACVAATDPQSARILTFIAASEGSHIPALRNLQS